MNIKYWIGGGTSVKLKVTNNCDGNHGLDIDDWHGIDIDAAHGFG